MNRRSDGVIVRVSNFDNAKKNVLSSVSMSYFKKQYENNLRKQVREIAEKIFFDNGIENKLNRPGYAVEILTGHTVNKIERFENLLGDCYSMLQVFSEYTMPEEDENMFNNLMSELTTELDYSYPPDHTAPDSAKRSADSAKRSADSAESFRKSNL